MLERPSIEVHTHESLRRQSPPKLVAVINIYCICRRSQNVVVGIINGEILKEMVIALDHYQTTVGCSEPHIAAGITDNGVDFTAREIKIGFMVDMIIVEYRKIVLVKNTQSASCTNPYIAGILVRTDRIDHIVAETLRIIRLVYKNLPCTPLHVVRMLKKI